MRGIVGKYARGLYQPVFAVETVQIQEWHDVSEQRFRQNREQLKTFRDTRLDVDIHES